MIITYSQLKIMVNTSYSCMPKFKNLNRFPMSDDVNLFCNEIILSICDWEYKLWEYKSNKKSVTTEAFLL